MPHGFGVSKGATSLLLIGAFLAMHALREEKALMSYGFFQSLPVAVRLHPDTFVFLFRLLCLLLVFLRFRLLTPPFGLSVLFTPQEVVQVVVASVYVRRVPDAQPVFLPQFLNSFHSRLVVVEETVDAPVTAQWLDCFGEVGSRVQHDVVLPVKVGTVRTSFQPQGEEGEVVHEALEEVAGLLRLFLPYVGDVLRCYAALEQLVAYLVASRTVEKTNGKVGFAASQIAHLPAFSFCQFRIYPPLPQIGQ